jgi:hypothetical protein
VDEGRDLQGSFDEDEGEDQAQADQEDPLAERQLLCRSR